MTFPYCLKVFLNLWTRLIDLSCNGSGSEVSDSAGLCLGASVAKGKGLLSSGTLWEVFAGCDEKAVFFEAKWAAPAWRHRLGGSSARITLHPTLGSTDCPFKHWKTLVRGKNQHVPCASWDAEWNRLRCILDKCGWSFYKEETRVNKPHFNGVISTCSNATYNSQILNGFLFYFKEVFLIFLCRNSYVLEWRK